jgi:hypothetical protein
MKDGRCSKHYPREFNESTTMDNQSYPTYHRSNNGRHVLRGEFPLDNRWVVPYNAYLSLKYDSHINVEICCSVTAVKYIHKYIYKGGDRTTLELAKSIDEIKQHIDARFIGASEAAWRIFSFRMHAEVPNVVRLQVHLEGGHLVVFDPDQDANEILQRAQNQTTTLTGWFKANSENLPGARDALYQEFPSRFVWTKPQWKVRQRGFALGRMYFIAPSAGEVYYLRLLLTVVKGATSWANLRTVNGVEHPTFKAATLALGLLDDDTEWRHCLRDAAHFKTGHQLRWLFGMMLEHCCPSEPEKLWDEFKERLCDDLRRQLVARGIDHPAEDQIYDYGLYLINLALLPYGKSLDKFPDMPIPVGNWDDLRINRLIAEQENFGTPAQLEARAANNIGLLNLEQLSAFSAITDSVQEKDGKLFFLHGPAGTGKTFVYNTLCDKIRSQSMIVLCVASSGIAALLLSGGRTAHSRFKVPLDIHEDTMCTINATSQLAGLIKKTDLIIWDEVPMQSKLVPDAVDRSLRDLLKDDRPFGGITVVFGGDFQQILPVVIRGTREQIVNECLQRSRLWTRIQVLHLRKNMRLEADAQNVQFAKWLLDVGSGVGVQDGALLNIPEHMKCRGTVENLLWAIYPQLQAHHDDQYFLDRTILCPRNDDVDFINRFALAQFPGEEKIFYSADSVVEEGGVDAQEMLYSVEYLNTLQPAGLPLYRLALKKGCPLMLLRNLAPADGLCNGSRMILLNMTRRVLEVRLLGGEHAGKTAFIPRISLTPPSTEVPFKMQRRQFPVRLAFSMTINKSQGQSVKHVGIDLRTPVFTHGQLYVALSRSTSAQRIKILFPNDEQCSTTNIVYPEVLL